MTDYYRSVLRPAARTKILNKKLFAFKDNRDCITINKEKGLVYLRYGKYGFSNWCYYRDSIEKQKKLQNSSLKEKIMNLDTRHGLGTTTVITEETINLGIDLSTININEIDNIKHEIDLRVQQHQHFKKILDNFPNVPEGYTGWFEIEKIPL